jgi:hypothetical protein
LIEPREGEAKIALSQSQGTAPASAGNGGPVRSILKTGTNQTPGRRHPLQPRSILGGSHAYLSVGMGMRL